jgi:HicB family
MDLTPFVEQLRRELAVAADAGGEDARALAERLTAPLESSIRLALLSALAAGAEEITGQLAPGSVDVRLRGSDIGFVVTPPPTAHGEPRPEPADPAPSAGAAEPDDGGTARISLRLPEQLKSRAEEAAAREGLSVNAWLVRAVQSAVDGSAHSRQGERHRARWSGQTYSGWVR